MDIRKLLELSVEKNASDLHIIPGLVPQMRIDGVLVPIKNSSPLSPEEARQLIYSVMLEHQQRDFEQDLVLELAISIPKVGNFRVSILHQLHGIGAVFRVIPEKIPSFADLSLPTVFKSLLAMPHGLILVAGPTGSGKSTTLAAMIDYINTYHAYNIITIEDPIEFVHTSKKSVFHQLQVGRDTPDFATALRASLRQDPNVILIGELRDLETMHLALTAAETGHLVLATLHARSAPLAINRFADVFPTEEKNRVRTLLSETLQAVICQMLVRKTAGGRVAAFETLLVTPAVRHFVCQNMPAHLESAMQMGRNKGMCTLEQYLHDLVAKRVINPLVAESVLMNRGLFKDSQDDKTPWSKKR